MNLLDIPQEAKDFLIEADLPDSAAPYLNFESTDKDGATSFKNITWKPAKEIFNK